MNSSNLWQSLPWFRQLVTGLSPRRPAFDPRPVHVRSVVDKLILGKGKGKGKGHPITGHEGPEGSRCIALLFLQPGR